MSHKYRYVIYDTETSGSDPYKTCLLEIAAIVVDGRDLTPIDGGVFHSFMRPSHILSEVSPDDPLIQDGALAVNGISRSQIGSFPEEKLVWNNFVDFCGKYATSKNNWRKLIPVGWNIVNFDNILVRRMIEKHSSKTVFHPNLCCDLMDDLFLFSEGIGEKDGPEKMSFDYWREYLCLPDNSEYGATHGAMRDCVDMLMVFQRFQNWKRRLVKKNPLKGSFATQGIK